jgi:hypothetical protein
MGDSSSSSDSENDIVPLSTTSAVRLVVSQEQQGKEQTRATRAPRVPRRTHSVAHEEFEAKNIVLFNVDLETGGDSCGPVQISVAAYDPHGMKNLAEFDSYVKPAKGAQWSQATINVHGILPSQQRIKDASELEEVWYCLLQYFQLLLQGGKKGIILAWGGKACDVEWMFRITEESHQGILLMPENVPFFCDPRQVINHYKGCGLRFEGMLGLGCAEMWCHVMGKEKLEGAHSAIVDARAQQDIVKDDRFLKFLDKPESMVTMESVWAAKRKKRQLQNAELKRPLPKGWTEDEHKWEIPRRMAYEGSQGGAPHGPSTKAKTVFENGSLAELFFLLFPLSLVLTIAKQTQQYGMEDWVCPVESTRQTSSTNDNSNDDDDDNSNDEDESNDDDKMDGSDEVGMENEDLGMEDRNEFGMEDEHKKEEESDDDIEDDRHDRPKQARKFRPCKEENPNARHRSIGTWIDVTAGFVIVWLGATLILGATKLRTAEMMYCTNYGTNIPFVQNAIGRDAFRQMRQFIHFADNNKLPKKRGLGWNPLQKVAPVINPILASLAAAWILGKQFVSKKV